MWHALDEYEGIERTIHAVQAYVEEYSKAESAVFSTARDCADGKVSDRSWDGVAIAVLLLDEIDGTLTLTKKESRVWHARLYDTRNKFGALERALLVAATPETLEIDGFLLLRAWVYRLDEIGEKWTAKLRARIVSVLKDWCIKQSIPLVFKDVRGISFDKGREQWQARITESGKRRRLGYYASKGEACLAVLKYERTAPPKPRRKPRGMKAYLGVVEHPDEAGMWALEVPSTSYTKYKSDYSYDGISYTDADCIEEFLDHTGQDYSCGGETIGRYTRRSDAAHAYDDFARRYCSNPRLNFPEIGELKADGEPYLPPSWTETDAAAWKFINGISYVPFERKDRSVGNEDWGVLPLVGGGEVFVGASAARALSRFRWYSLPAEIADAFERLGDVPAELQRLSRSPAFGAHNDDAETIANYLIPIGGWELAAAVFEQWQRNGASAIWTVHHSPAEGKCTFLPLEEAVYMVYALECPRKGTIEHVGENKYDYSVDSLALA